MSECEGYANTIMAERVRQVEATSPSLVRRCAVEATSPSLQEEKPSGGDAASTGEEKKSGEDAASTVYFDPKAPIGFVKGGNLPHWRQGGTTYFVTWRTADSMPAERVAQWTKERQNWIATHPEPHDTATRAEYDRLFSARWERWLDEGHGEGLLRRPEIKAIVESTLRHIEATSPSLVRRCAVEATSPSLQKKSGEDAASTTTRYRLGDFVVMPNHVHVVVTPQGEHCLSDIVQAWKSFTAHAINKALGRKGAFWQKESFDHIVRNPEQLERIKTYVCNQTVEATFPLLVRRGAVEATSSSLQEGQPRVEATPSSLQEGQPSGGDAASTRQPSGGDAASTRQPSGGEAASTCEHS